ncbi:MAG: S41 family peptidase [Gemmatimonadaceae bacterium]
MSISSRLVLVFAVLGSSLLFGGWLLGRGMRDTASPYARAHLFEDVLTHVERYYVDSVPASELYDKAMTGMLEELGDPHTLYLGADRLKRLTESTSGNYTGLGVQVDVRDGWPTVLAPLPGGPAERAGLQSGDRIIEVAGKTTRGLTGDEVRGILRGPVGATLELMVERPGSHGQLLIRVTRGEIHRKAVRRTALLGGGVGFVDVKVFSDSTELELTHAIDSLSKAGMTSLILDLRGNPGGLLAQGVDVADLFLDEGKSIARIKGRIPEANRVFDDGSPQRWPALPLAVLIDEGSASASEIVAGALQDHDRAVLVGRTSYGKGSAQSLYPTAVGGALKLTTARWFTPAGRSIDRSHVTAGSDEADRGPPARERFRTDAGRTVFGGGGITPDVVVGDTALSIDEMALQAALGDRVTAFRDAVTAYALELKAAGGPSRVDFTVTPDMLDGLWRTMQRRGFRFDRSVYDRASGLVSRLLARDVARYVFGPAAEARRSIDDDEVIQAAVSLVHGARSQADLLARAGKKQP